MQSEFNVACEFIDRNVRQGRARNVALECDTERVTYGQLRERVNRAGNALLGLDVRPEERVLLLLPNIPEFLYCFFGAIKAGVVPVPVNPQLTAREYEYLLQDSRARVAVAGETGLAVLQSIPRERLRYLRKVVAGERNGGESSLRQLMAAASPELEPEPCGRDAVAFWLYSSGSTGPPKGCVHLHHDMVVCAELYAEHILRMTGSDRCYSAAPLFFAYGLGNAGYFPLYFGATAILSAQRPVPERVYADIERFRPTLFFSVPSHYAALLAHHPSREREFDLSSVRHAISAGEPLPSPLFERFQQRFGIEILDAWGSTETLNMVISNRPGDIRPGSSGKVIPGMEARIVDEAGQAVERGAIGNLLVRSDATCAAYWNQHEKSKDTFQGQWFRTGDMYYQDEDGFFWYTGRADDVFKVNGRWLSPAEVESALIAHAAVHEAAVIAWTDENGLTKPAAYVVLAADRRPSEDLVRELQQWVTQQIGRYKRPRWIEFVPELPKTATGKPQRYRLRELARQHSPQPERSLSGEV